MGIIVIFRLKRKGSYLEVAAMGVF